VAAELVAAGLSLPAQRDAIPDVDSWLPLEQQTA
jgi:hypothetical protein